MYIVLNIFVIPDDHIRKWKAVEIVDVLILLSSIFLVRNLIDVFYDSMIMSQWNK